MGRGPAFLKSCFPHPTPRSGAQRESSAGAFGHGVSSGEYATNYPAFALRENSAAPFVSQGHLVLGDGKREKQCLTRSTYKQRQGGEEGEDLQDQ